MTGEQTSVSELGLSVEVVSFLRDAWGIETLYPPQAEAVVPVLAGSNTLVAIPTASGKSLVAYLGIFKRLLDTEPGSKAVYVVPLKALAAEKYAELSQICEAVDLRVGLAIGDRDGEQGGIEGADILVCTSEKLDSLVRNRPGILAGLGVVVADEIHLVHDSSRGPTMEINLTRFRHHHPHVQLIGLSATIGNPQQLADWLEAELVTSNWRPVVLEQSTLAGVELEPRLRICQGEDGMEGLQDPRRLSGPASQPMAAALDDTIEQDAQMLIFVSTRRSAQSEARKLSERLGKRLARDDPVRLERLSALAEELGALRLDSDMADALIAAVRGGVAFHHAGLTSKQRRAVEQAFRGGVLACIVATPTLAAGVNLPARRVIIRDLKRFEDGLSRWLSTMEVQQMLGRAGRPQYDDIGEAWLHCKGDGASDLADQVAMRYIHGELEDITSKLAAENALRTHILSLIATGGLGHRHALDEFFARTFLGHTHPTSMLTERLEHWIQWLAENELIERGGIDEALGERLAQEASSIPEEEWADETPDWARFAGESEGVGAVDEPEQEISSIAPESLHFTTASDWATSMVQAKVEEPKAMTYSASAFGQQVTRLYLDPTSGLLLRDGLRRALRRIWREDTSDEVTEAGLLYLIASAHDFLTFWWRESEYDRLHEKASLIDEDLLNDTGLEDTHLARIKSTWVLEDWIEESSQREIENTHGVMPGDLRTRIDLAEWLLFAAKQIAQRDQCFGPEHEAAREQLVSRLEDLRRRIRHGCKAELLDLVNLPNVGRKRARDLVGFGITRPADLIELSERDRGRLLAMQGWGPKLLDRMIARVAKLSGARKRRSDPRRDDEPLPGER